MNSNSRDGMVRTGRSGNGQNARKFSNSMFHFDFNGGDEKVESQEKI